MEDQNNSSSQNRTQFEDGFGLSQSSNGDVRDFMSEVRGGSENAADSALSGEKNSNEAVTGGFVRLLDFVSKQKKQRSKQSVLSMAIAKYHHERDRFGGM